MNKMKPYGNIGQILRYLFAVVVTLSVLALLTYIYPSTAAYMGFNKKELVDTIGLIIGSLSFAFGAYFALLAVDAYAHVKEIRVTNEAIQLAALNLTKRQKEFTETNESITLMTKRLYLTGEQMFNLLSIFSSSVPRPKADKATADRLEKLENDIIEGRARFALSFSSDIGPSERQKHIRHLANQGKVADRALFEKLVNAVDIDQESRDLARILSKELIRIS